MTKRPENTLPVGSDDFIAFNDLYNKNYQGFVRFAHSYLNDRAIAEDFVADSFLAYWNNHSRIEPDSKAKVYILVVLRNKCLNHLRKKKNDRAYIDKMSDLMRWDLSTRINTLEACNPEEVFSREIRQIVEHALESLPEKTLRVFKLSRYEHKSNQEIAEILGVSVKGVEFHITKALNILRNELSDYLSAFLFVLLM